MGSLMVLAEPLRYAMALVPLWLFVSQDMARWKVKDPVLLVMLVLIPVVGALDVFVGATWYLPLVGASVYLAASLFIREAAYRATGIDAFGQADLVLFAFAGVFLGWTALLIWLLLGSLLGVAYWAFLYLARKRKGKRPRRRVPAGPGFAAAQVTLMLAQSAGFYQGWPFVY